MSSITTSGSSTYGKDKCSRCGNKGYIRDNGLCMRCDNVVYGKKENE